MGGGGGGGGGHKPQSVLGSGQITKLFEILVVLVSYTTSINEYAKWRRKGGNLWIT